MNLEGLLFVTVPSPQKGELQPRTLCRDVGGGKTLASFAAAGIRERSSGQGEDGIAWAFAAYSELRSACGFSPAQVGTEI